MFSPYKDKASTYNLEYYINKYFLMNDQGTSKIDNISFGIISKQHSFDSYIMQFGSNLFKIGSYTMQHKHYSRLLHNCKLKSLIPKAVSRSFIKT